MAWEGPTPGDTFGGKPLLCHQDRPAFAELVILWSFMEAGWQGAWIDSFGGRRLKDYWPEPVHQAVPEEQEALLQRLDGGGARPVQRPRTTSIPLITRVSFLLGSFPTRSPRHCRSSVTI